MRRHDLYTGGIGMHAVGLIELRVQRYAFERERKEHVVITRGEARIDGVEAGRIFGPEVARRFHAEQQDTYMRGLKFAEHGGDVFLRERGIDAAERIVGPEFD